jgi:predicted RNA-binding protein with RPS1 domain
MQLEVGKIYDGKVKNLAKFGAFVEIKDTSRKDVTCQELSYSTHLAAGVIC